MLKRATRTVHFLRHKTKTPDRESVTLSVRRFPGCTLSGVWWADPHGLGGPRKATLGRRSGFSRPQSPSNVAKAVRSSSETRSSKPTSRVSRNHTEINFPHSPTICGMSVGDFNLCCFRSKARKRFFFGLGHSRLEEPAADFMIIRETTENQNSHQACCKHPCRGSRTNQIDPLRLPRRRSADGPMIGLRTTVELEVWNITTGCCCGFILFFSVLFEFGLGSLILAVYPRVSSRWPEEKGLVDLMVTKICAQSSPSTMVWVSRADYLSFLLVRLPNAMVSCSVWRFQFSCGACRANISALVELAICVPDALL